MLNLERRRCNPPAPRQSNPRLRASIRGIVAGIVGRKCRGQALQPSNTLFKAERRFKRGTVAKTSKFCFRQPCAQDPLAPIATRLRCGPLSQAARCVRGPAGSVRLVPEREAQPREERDDALLEGAHVLQRQHLVGRRIRARRLHDVADVRVEAVVPLQRDGGL
eukprot:295018-Alexandrium_andersonii.AAC.2